MSTSVEQREDIDFLSNDAYFAFSHAHLDSSAHRVHSTHPTSHAQLSFSYSVPMSQPLLRHFGPRQNLRGRHFHNLTKRVAVAGPVAPAERVLASDDLAPLVWAHFQQPKYTPQERNEIINYMLINSTCWRTAAHLLWGNLEDILKLLDLLDLHKWEHPKINRQLRGQAYLK